MANTFSLKTSILKRALSKKITRAVIAKIGRDMDIDIQDLELDGDDIDEMKLHVELDIRISADDLAAILEQGTW